MSVSAPRPRIAAAAGLPRPSQPWRPPDGPMPPAFSLEDLRRPRLHLPDRDYLLLVGPLPAALQIGWRPTADWFDPQSPNLFWPARQEWCVASEVDFDSTLV